MQTGRHFLSSCSEVNSTGYPEIDEPISARHQRYPLFKYILIKNISGKEPRYNECRSSDYTLPVQEHVRNVSSLQTFSLC